MQTHTDITAGATPPAAYQPKKIEDGTRHGLTLRVWMHGPESFRFDIRDEAGVVIHDDSQDHGNAGRAGRAAELWINEEVKQREAQTDGADAWIFAGFEDAEVVAWLEVEGFAAGDLPDEAAVETSADWTVALPPAEVVAGWRLQVVDDGRGSYAIDARSAASGEECPTEFKGYMDWGDALGEARAWALAHPCDGSAPVGGAEDPRSPVEELAEENVAEVVGSPNDAPAEVAAPAPALIEAPPAAATEPSKPARSQRAARPPRQQLLSALDPRVDQTWTMLARRKELRAEIRCQRGEVSTANAKIKAAQAELDELEAQLDDFEDEDGMPGQAQLPLSPAPRTFANDEETRAGVVAGATQAAAQLGPNAVTWPFNGVDYVISVEPQGEGRFRATFRGHPEIEGFGETREQAIEHAKNDASIRLENTDPGSPEAAHDAGPVADANESTARRTKRKDPFADKTADFVIAVLRASKEVAEAIEKLECTQPQLKKFLAKGGTKISDHLAKDCTELPEPPTARASARGAAAPKAAAKTAAKTAAKAGSKGGSGGRGGKR